LFPTLRNFFGHDALFYEKPDRSSTAVYQDPERPFVHKFFDISMALEDWTALEEEMGRWDSGVLDGYNGGVEDDRFVFDSLELRAESQEILDKFVQKVQELNGRLSQVAVVTFDGVEDDYGRSVRVQLAEDESTTVTKNVSVTVPAGFQVRITLEALAE
jgi:hypothetical protein